MIKTLLNADEEPPPGIKVVVEETIVNPPPEIPIKNQSAVEELSENFETRQVFEIPEDAKFFTNPNEQNEDLLQIEEVAEPKFDTAKDDFVNLKSPEAETANSPNVEQIADEKVNNNSVGTIFQSEYKPESPDETIRQSGLAYSAAIVFFGSVVFMMIFGWFADQLLGSAPWGLVGGILLGGLIGFIQFFRITSQIFKK
jgi:F0F1-type ATP synthase assembly protein I